MSNVSTPEIECDRHTPRSLSVISGRPSSFTRLAALLYDLAEHKHMSLNSRVEEILLHTNESLGDGVASPHTRRTLRYIQELKKKHGIDYDSHASYRFVEES